jgi:hypothetical protein
MIKEIKSGHCDRCGNDEEEIIKFENSNELLCYECLTLDGICHKCGDYIPFPEDEHDELNILCDNSDYTPSLCLSCFSSTEP